LNIGYTKISKGKDAFAGETTMNVRTVWIISPYI